VLVIVDTGSVDDTVGIVRQLPFPAPIHLHERPWVDFASNRNELLRLASPLADYLLLLDADHTLEGTLPPLTADVYNLRVRTPSLEYVLPRLVRAALPWGYEGVVHEYLLCEQAEPPELLDGLTIIDHCD